MTKETKETEKTEEDLETTVSETYFARAKAHIFAEIGVHLTRNQIVNYCLNYTLNEKTRQPKS
tara:strand:+ start:81 stop:269 length:189 start_codon:yes stop_codon:yes gene_type:complete